MVFQVVGNLVCICRSTRKLFAAFGRLVHQECRRRGLVREIRVVAHIGLDSALGLSGISSRNLRIGPCVVHFAQFLVEPPSPAGFRSKYQEAVEMVCPILVLFAKDGDARQLRV